MGREGNIARCSMERGEKVGKDTKEEEVHKAKGNVAILKDN